MSYDPLSAKLIEIENRLKDLTPEERTKILDWIKQGKEKTDRIKKAVSDLQDSLDTLRVLVKYIMFDLEATRRENMDLRADLANLQEILENQGYFAGAENPPLEMEPPPADSEGLIALPETGDFIHNNECDHPYSPDCWCDHCEAYRERQQDTGAQGAD